MSARVKAPKAEDLIADLMEHYREFDPEDRHGFGTREIWDFRLTSFGYVQLFSDWYSAVGNV